MASLTALPIARLRSLGCKVSTVIGHDPNIADFIYSVRLPDDVDLAGSAGRQAPFGGVGMVEVPKFSDGHHLIVKACSNRVGQSLPDRSTRDRNATIAASLLTAVADIIQEA